MKRLSRLAAAASGPPAQVASGDVFGFSEVHDHVCMLFSDIVSYTTMTESSQPLEIMRLVRLQPPQPANVCCRPQLTKSTCVLNEPKRR